MLYRHGYQDLQKFFNFLCKFQIRIAQSFTIIKFNLYFKVTFIAQIDSLHFIDIIEIESIKKKYNYT